MESSLSIVWLLSGKDIANQKFVVQYLQVKGLYKKNSKTSIRIEKMFEKYISSFPTVRPPAGSPAANSSFKPSEISDTIDFSRGLPGFTVGNKSHYQIANASGTIEFIIENFWRS